MSLSVQCRSSSRHRAKGNKGCKVHIWWLDQRCALGGVLGLQYGTHCWASIERNSSEPRLLSLMEFLRRETLWAQVLASLPNLHTYSLQSFECTPQIQVHLFVKEFCKWPWISLIAFALPMYQKSLNSHKTMMQFFMIASWLSMHTSLWKSWITFCNSLIWRLTDMLGLNGTGGWGSSFTGLQMAVVHPWLSSWEYDHR